MLDEGAPPATSGGGDPGGEGLAFAGDDPDEDETLDRLAAVSPECALLRDALAATSARKRRVFLMFSAQQASGDPSPAVTVGDAFGLTPANVRQIVRRVRTALAHLTVADARYAELGDLALLRGGEATAA